MAKLRRALIQRGSTATPLAHGGLRWLLPRAAVNASGVVGLSTAISSRVPVRATLNGVCSQAPLQIRSARRNYASEAFRGHLGPPHLTNRSPGPSALGRWSCGLFCSLQVLLVFASERFRMGVSPPGNPASSDPRSAGFLLAGRPSTCSSRNFASLGAVDVSRCQTAAGGEAHA